MSSSLRYFFIMGNVRSMKVSYPSLVKYDLSLEPYEGGSGSHEQASEFLNSVHAFGVLVIFHIAFFNAS